MPQSEKQLVIRRVYVLQDWRDVLCVNQMQPKHQLHNNTVTVLFVKYRLKCLKFLNTAAQELECIKIVELCLQLELKWQHTKRRAHVVRFIQLSTSDIVITNKRIRRLNVSVFLLILCLFTVHQNVAQLIFTFLQIYVFM